MPLIRPFQPRDLSPLLEIFQQNVPEYFASHEEADFQAYLQSFSESYFVLEDKGALLGGAGIRLHSAQNHGQITWIFFHPDQQGKGLGKRLMNFCMEKISSQPELEKVYLCTSQLAYRFFAKFDFCLVVTQKDYWAPGLDLYKMEKRLRD